MTIDGFPGHGQFDPGCIKPSAVQDYTVVVIMSELNRQKNIFVIKIFLG